MLISPEVTVSYPNLFKAVTRKTKPGDKPAKPKFSGTFLFTPAAMASAETAALLAAVKDAAVAKFGQAVFAAMLAEDTFDSPFKKDITGKGYDPEIFARYISSESNEEYPPVIRSRSGAVITDTREIYAGALVRVSLAARAYGGPGTGYKAGVKLDLRNVQKLGDGTRLVAGSGDGSEFGTYPDAPPADMPADGAALSASDAAAMAKLLG